MNINLGYIHIASYTPKESLFPGYWLDEKDNDKEDIERNKKEIESCPEDEIILEPNKTWNLEIDYPLTNPYKVEVYTYETGMTRREVVNMIVKHYKKIYKEEDKSTKIKVGRAGHLLNRNQTDGKYGIWGHDIGDLILHTLYKNKKTLKVGVDS